MEQVLLKKEVERVVGHQLKEARDFEELSLQLLKGTRERLSPTTLKRLWGYLKHEEVQTRQHTLDVLARFVGYKCYDDFCGNVTMAEEVQSGVTVAERVAAGELQRFLSLSARRSFPTGLRINRSNNKNFVKPIAISE